MRTRRFWLVVLILAAMLAQSASITAADWIYEPVVLDVGATTLKNGDVFVGRKAYYCVYLGSEEARRIDARSDVMNGNLSLVHPAPGVAARMRVNAKERWYAVYTSSEIDGGGGATVPLLTADVWESIPAPLQHILAALGVDDPDLILISAHLDSGGIYIYFDPRHNQDESFVGQKCSILEHYIRTHDLESALPLESVSPD